MLPIFLDLPAASLTLNLTVSMFFHRNINRGLGSKCSWRSRSCLSPVCANCMRFASHRGSQSSHVSSVRSRNGKKYGRTIVYSSRFLSAFHPPSCTLLPCLTMFCRPPYCYHHWLVFSSFCFVTFFLSGVAFFRGEPRICFLHL